MAAVREAVREAAMRTVAIRRRPEPLTLSAETARSPLLLSIHSLLVSFRHACSSFASPGPFNTIFRCSPPPASGCALWRLSLVDTFNRLLADMLMSIRSSVAYASPPARKVFPLSLARLSLAHIPIPYIHPCTSHMPYYACCLSCVLSPCVCGGR